MVPAERFRPRLNGPGEHKRVIPADLLLDSGKKCFHTGVCWLGLVLRRPPGSPFLHFAT